MRKYQILRFLSYIRALFLGEPQLYRKYVALSEANLALSTALKEKITGHIDPEEWQFFEKFMAERQAHLDTMDLLSATYRQLDESLARQQELLAALQEKVVQP